MAKLVTFWKEHSGAANMEWVVLTASMLTLAMVLSFAVSGAMKDLSADTEVSMAHSTLAGSPNASAMTGVVPDA